MSRPARKPGSQHSVNSAVKGICNIMRRSDCAGALQYVPELTWILFLRILDEREEHEAVDLATLKQRTFYGREKDTHVYPIALLNLVLHGIDEPRIWHGNTLSKTAVSETLFAGAPAFFDVVLMNPPFGGKVGAE